MPAWQPSDIGPLYDYGIATRDGSALACKNKDGKTVQVSSLAFMASPDRANNQEEATELQEKAALIQLSSSNLIDREFDQWPQVTQGDWTGGAGQRVAGVSGTFNQYYDGEGILWPLEDYIPQKPLPGPILPGSGIFSGTSFIRGGVLAGAGNGYAWVGYSRAGPNNFWNVSFQAGDTSYTFSSVAVNETLVAMVLGHGHIWVVNTPFSSANIILRELALVAGVLTEISTTTIKNDKFSPPIVIAATGLLGSKAYIAIALSYQTTAVGNPTDNEVKIYDISTGGNPLATSTTLTFPVQASFSFTDLDFQGSNLNIVISDGFNATIVQSQPPFSASATLAILPGLGNAYITSVGGALFVIGYSQAANGVISRMDIFTLNGTSLTEFGSVVTPTPFLQSVSSPVSFGGYALWAVAYELPGATTVTLTVYAFDVVRSRLFRVLTYTAVSYTHVFAFQHIGVGVFGTTSRTVNVAPATIQSQWGFALAVGAVAGAAEVIREFYLGVLPLTPTPAFTGLLQMGVSLTSGLIDFTAATNKLFRQLVADFFNGLVATEPSPSVTLNVWFDQDPSRLAASPDFTANTGTPVAPLPSALKLPTNKVARKLVYQVISDGGGYDVAAAAWENAPKIVDVVVQAATGWVVDAVFDLSPNIQTNAKNVQEYAYQHQSVVGGPTIDPVVAYNFLKQIWRLKGGEITLTLPNKDSYNALIQQLKFASPKPFAASFRSDVQTTFQSLCTLKIREDI